MAVVFASGRPAAAGLLQGKAAKERRLASLAALRWDIAAEKSTSTKMNQVPGWAGGVGGLCKACSAAQKSASSLKILLQHPTA